jgi:acetyl-CoA C-acetyltransferase
VVIVSGVRTPFSKFGGALKEIHSTDLGVIVIKESFKRAGFKGEELDEVYYGMCDQAEAALYDNVNASSTASRAKSRMRGLWVRTRNGPRLIRPESSPMNW